MRPERWALVKPIFFEAVERPPSERANFVRARCKGDEQLLAEIDSLLAAHDQAVGFIESPPDDTRSMPDVAPGKLVGRRIGQYEVVRQIGSGGMGTVYLASRADEQFRRLVAVKIIRSDFDNQSIIRRFRNERQILASLDHPNISRLLDGGTTEDGSPYFVMEFIEGKPITHYCDARRLTTSERLRLFREICSAVHYSHQNLIVHRDLKPSNILVTEEGTVKLLDFGIAKLIVPSAKFTDASTVTTRVMTPVYASPEQVRGETITTSSDIYSLGVLLYELLCGHRPYRVDTISPLEVIRAVCEQEPEKPSTAVWRSEITIASDGELTVTPEAVSRARDSQPERLRRELRGDLDTIVLKAMRKEPARRYASVEQFSEDIRRYLEGLPVIARKDTIPYRAAKFVRRKKAGVTAITIIVILSIVCAMLLRRGTGDVSVKVKSVAVLPLRSLDPNEGDSSIGLKITDALIQRFGRLDQVVVRPTRSVQKYDADAVDPLAAGREQKVDVVLDGSFQRADNRLRLRVEMRRVSDGRQLWASTFDERSTDPFYLEDALAEQAAQALLPHLAREERALIAKHYTENAEANRLYLEGRYYWNKRTEPAFHQAIEFFTQAISKDPDYALAYAGLADCYSLLSVWGGQPPNEALSKAEATAAKAVELDRNLSEAHTSLGFAKWIYDRDWAAAEREFQEAIRIKPAYATAHHWYSYFLAGMKRFDEAIAQIKQARDMDELSPSINTDVGEIYCWAGRYDQALDQLQQVLKSEPNFPPARNVLGMVYVKLGRMNEGVAELEAARRLDDGPRVLSALGCAYGLAGRPADAQKILATLERMSTQRYVSPFARALVNAGLGNRHRAFALLDETYKEHSDNIVILGVYPWVDILRSDQRFPALLRRIGLQP